MPMSLLALHAVTITFAIAMMVAAARTAFAKKDDRVIHLGDTIYPWKVMVAMLGCFALLAPVLWVVFTSGVMPRGEPVHFAVFLIAFSVGFVSGLLALSSVMMRQSAIGTITLVDERTVRVELLGHVTTMTPSSVHIAPCFGPSVGLWALFELSDAEQSIHFFGMVPISAAKLMTGDARPPNGTLIVGQATPLLEWARVRPASQ